MGTWAKQGYPAFMFFYSSIDLTRFCRLQGEIARSKTVSWQNCMIDTQSRQLYKKNKSYSVIFFFLWGKNPTKQKAALILSCIASIANGVPEVSKKLQS